ncbi:MAG: beta-ketoacyl-ACP synthase II [Candidatus Eremiobacteraeota bacterium]|nr:beta-ketoacyl-ACP synthase II [Candidatus Eremiobacteraeota bacterium]
MEKRRVVVTGLGAITPLGNDYQSFWEGLVTGRSGVGPTTAFDPAKLPTRISAEVKDFDPDALFGRRDARRMDRYAQMALAAAREALEDAKFPDDPDVRARTGAVVATGIGGIITIEGTTDQVQPKQAWDRISPFFVPMLMGNAASAQISMTYGLRGPVFAVSSACASANDAFCIAYDKIVLGEAIAVVTGGSEAAVTPVAMGGFSSMKAMSTRNDDPTRASRPFDKERDGFILGEGAGIMIFEDREHALGRGAPIYAEVLGYGQSADAFHIAQPDPESKGVVLAMERALARSEVRPEQVGYINAHGTSTPLGDAAESQAIARVFGEHATSGKVAVSSTKSMHGHLLGAAGAVEGIATVLALHHGILPPTINYEVPDPECTLDYVPNVARKTQVEVAMSNGFGFGGHNTTVVFGRHV